VTIKINTIRYTDLPAGGIDSDEPRPSTTVEEPKRPECETCRHRIEILMDCLDKSDDIIREWAPGHTVQIEDNRRALELALIGADAKR
jgi:hypothetical protein